MMVVMDFVEKAAILVFALAVMYTVYDYSQTPPQTPERELIQIIEKRLDYIEQTVTELENENQQSNN